MSFPNDVAIVVCSCDKYRSVWTPFFKLLEKNLDTTHADIFLLTETAEIPQETLSFWCQKMGGVKHIRCNEKVWSKRIKDSLRQIENEYIFFLLEDFFPQAPVDTNQLKKLVGWMRDDERISAIRIFPFWEECIFAWTKYKDNFLVIDRNYKERVNAQATIWRKERLIEILDDSESAWQFEILASNRSRKDPYLYLGYYEPWPLNGIFPYQFAPAYGYGITAGKWLWNNPLLFQENGIACDFSELGVMSEKEWTRSWKSKTLRLYRRGIKLLNILKAKIKAREKIDLKSIANDSLANTKFELLNGEDYQYYTAMDSKPAPPTR